MAKNSNVVSIFKKNRIAIVAVLVFALALCSVFAFAANRSENSANEDISAEVLPEVNKTVLLNGYGIYIDGYLIAAAETEEQASQMVEDALNERIKALNIDASANNSFANSVSYIQGNFEENAFKTSVVANLGEIVTDYSGEHLPVTLSVKTVTNYSESVVLAYNSKIQYTDSLKDGVSKVTSEGFNGVGVQNYEIVLINGVETERNKLTLDVTTAPKDEIINVGTRSDGVHSPASVMNFVEPYKPDRWVITSYMGPRWGTVHQGLDIARDGGCFGDPAYAACDGVVIKASDTGNGYGKCVIIDHGNGITTLYAHFTKCLVEVGDVVKAGDEVGLIGSTGYSYGPHLHFEVRIDDVPVNPLMFVDYE